VFYESNDFRPYEKVNHINNMFVTVFIIFLIKVEDFKDLPLYCSSAEVLDFVEVLVPRNPQLLSSTPYGKPDVTKPRFFT